VLQVVDCDTARMLVVVLVWFDVMVKLVKGGEVSQDDICRSVGGCTV
jgi:hypothetical protein